MATIIDKSVVFLDQNSPTVYSFSSVANIRVMIALGHKIWRLFYSDLQMYVLSEKNQCF